MKKRPIGRPKLNLLGFKTGKLTVIAEANRIDGCRAWLCTCECGVEKVYKAWYLHAKTPPMSCGCGQGKWHPRANLTHGMSYSKEYKTWSQIKQYCYNINCSAYNQYGGKGITVCDTWRGNFEVFYDDMGKIPSPDYVIRRIDVKLNFTPDNCKWGEYGE